MLSLSSLFILNAISAKMRAEFKGTSPLHILRKKMKYSIIAAMLLALTGCGSDSDNKNSDVAGRDYVPEVINADSLVITNENNSDVVNFVSEFLFEDDVAGSFLGGFSDGFSGVVIDSYNNSISDKYLNQEWLVKQYHNAQTHEDGFTGVKVTEDCSVSGNFTMDTNIDENSVDSGYVSIAYNNCNDGFEDATTNGTIYIGINGIEANEPPEYMTAIFKQFSINYGDAVVTIDGDMAIATSRSDNYDVETTVTTSDQLTLSMTFGSIELLNRTMKNMEIISQYNYYEGEGSSSFAGTIIDNELAGSLRISTPHNLNVSNDDLPYATPTDGILTIRGDSSKVTIFINDNNVVVESDYDNDRIVDNSEQTSWWALRYGNF